MSKKQLEEALELQKQGKFEESNDILRDLMSHMNCQGDVYYHYASNCDSQGNEREAVGYYEKALNEGLSSEDLQGAYLGLGSTYRTLGMYMESDKTLRKGIEAFPDDYALKVFHALTLYNLGNYEASTQLLLQCITETTDDAEILRYKKALEFYAPQLDKVW
ncbi:tetratricopeptide repeat protein [Geomicrobium sp. JCM 19055]|uniref:tetratricopeptide repeat protein n=1 Tax=Geomicrobium sp. JCM 19055 TaxID=1460649 RepID=UPI00045EDDDE|nr:tetratricopeptide repeat protein [Geomicrobium sp. JCM 19055]GAK01241.1 FOG protein containing TPR repeat [Geomicrobium sp. JCM 19055]